MSAVSSTPSLTPWFPESAEAVPSVKPVRAIGLIGLGDAAAGLAQACASRGLGVVLYDRDNAALADVVAAIRARFQAAVQRGEIAAAAAHKAMGGIGISTSLEDLEFCDAVIDLHRDEGAGTRARWVPLAELLPSDTIGAVAGGLPELEALSDVVREPARLVGLHFPAGDADPSAVSLTIGAKTARITVVRMLGLLAAIGRAAVLQGRPKTGG